jgi:spore maturation protein SpmA
MPQDADQDLAKKTRTVSLVIAGTMILWIGAQWIGSKLGIDTRYAVLLDLLALAAFTWAFIVIYQIWRARQKG